jgi:transaldolase
MGKLIDLYSQQRQSPWLDNIKRGWMTSGELERWVERGVRGLTSNPTIFQKAIEASSDYDEQLGDLVRGGKSVTDSYWDLVIKDIRDALRILRPVHDESNGGDGFVSIEVSPQMARDTEATTQSARHLHETIAEPNLFVKIPGTAEGVPSIEQMLSEGHSINVTLLFSLDRYEEIIEAYFSGLEAYAGDLSQVHSVASFFVSRVDTEADQRLETIGTPEALALTGKVGIANAQLAYKLFLERFQGQRWEALRARGAVVQRPLWASTSTKDPSLPDTLYVDTLIGPDTVNTMPDATLDAFDDHGAVARAVDADFDAAQKVLDDLAAVGVDLDDVTRVLEDEGVAKFEKSFDELINALQVKADDIAS